MFKVAGPAKGHTRTVQGRTILRNTQVRVSPSETQGTQLKGQSSSLNYENDNQDFRIVIPPAVQLYLMDPCPGGCDKGRLVSTNLLSRKSIRRSTSTIASVSGVVYAPVIRACPWCISEFAVRGILPSAVASVIVASMTTHSAQSAIVGSPRVEKWNDIVSGVSQDMGNPDVMSLYWRLMTELKLRFNRMQVKPSHARIYQMTRQTVNNLRNVSGVKMFSTDGVSSDLSLTNEHTRDLAGVHSNHYNLTPRWRSPGKALSASIDAPMVTDWSKPKVVVRLVM